MTVDPKKLTYKQCERKVVHLLAGNDAKIRRAGLKKLKLLINKRPSRSAASMEAYWKGLHYCMWMCPKPIPQEDLADEFCSILSKIPESASDCKRAFISGFFETEAREWNGLDYWRTDKFLMLVRRFFRHCLQWLAGRNWPNEEVEWFCFEVIRKVVFRSQHSCLGLQMFLIEITFDELKLYYEDDAAKKPAECFVKFFCNEAAHSSDYRVFNQFCKEVFDQFVLGFVAAQEKNAEDDSITWSFPLSLKRISEILFAEASEKGCSPNNRKRLYNYVRRMEDLSKASCEEIDKKFWRKVGKSPNSINLRLENWAAPKREKRRKTEHSDAVNLDSEQATRSEELLQVDNNQCEDNALKPCEEKSEEAQRPLKQVSPLWSIKNLASKTQRPNRNIKSQPAYMPLERLPLTVARSQEEYCEDGSEDETNEKLTRFVAEPPAFFKETVRKAAGTRGRKSSK